MKAYVRGPISVIEINEVDRTICDTTCDFMDEHPDGTIFCQLFSEDLEELEGGSKASQESYDVYVRTLDCVKNEVQTQSKEEAIEKAYKEGYEQGCREHTPDRHEMGG